MAICATWTAPCTERAPTAWLRIGRMLQKVPDRLREWDGSSHHEPRGLWNDLGSLRLARGASEPTEAVSKEIRLVAGGVVPFTKRSGFVRNIRKIRSQSVGALSVHCSVHVAKIPIRSRPVRLSKRSPKA